MVAVQIRHWHCCPPPAHCEEQVHASDRPTVDPQGSRGEAHASVLVTASEVDPQHGPRARGEVRASATATESGPEPRPNSRSPRWPGASACDHGMDCRTPLLQPLLRLRPLPPLPSSEPPSPAVGQKVAEVFEG